MSKKKPIISAFIVLALGLAIVLSWQKITAFSRFEVSKKDRLLSLPYLNHVSPELNPGEKGVVLHDPKRSFEGVNLFSCKGGAYFVDMKGRVLDVWDFPGFPYGYHSEAVELNGEISLLALAGEKERKARSRSLLKLDQNSQIIWSHDAICHHDLDAYQDAVYVLSKKKKSLDYSIVIWDDYITKLDSQGRVEKKLSVYQLLSNSQPEFKNKLSKKLASLRRQKQKNKVNQVIYRAKRKVVRLFKKLKKISPRPKRGAEVEDIFHPNTLELADKDSGVIKKGQALICLRNFHQIAIVDLEEEAIVWTWGEAELDQPHNPSLLDNGNILIFDNGASRRYSRIIELNPLTKKIVWEYKADPQEEFFSEHRGGAQKLPNGNILITESDRGRVFEITPEGDLVWEFLNPVFDSLNQRGHIYRMIRLDKKIAKRLGW